MNNYQYIPFDQFLVTKVRPLAFVTTLVVPSYNFICLSYNAFRVLC